MKGQKEKDSQEKLPKIGHGAKEEKGNFFLGCPSLFTLER